MEKWQIPKLILMFEHFKQKWLMCCHLQSDVYINVFNKVVNIIKQTIEMKGFDRALKIEP